MWHLLLNHTKLKKGNKALCGSRAYIHGDTMPNNIVQSLCWVNVSTLELDPSYVSIQSCISATHNSFLAIPFADMMRLFGQEVPLSNSRSRVTKYNSWREVAVSMGFAPVLGSDDNEEVLETPEEAIKNFLKKTDSPF